MPPSIGHRKRFERWRTRLPKHTAYLVDQVLSRIVPEFEARGFQWYDDFAGGDPKEIGWHDIPLQRRTGTVWPTVQILFARSRPFFNVDFACLPPVCRTNFGRIEIPREMAIVVYAPVNFRLLNGKSSGDICSFGYKCFSVSPRRKIDAEVDKVMGLLPFLFELFDRGIPDDWLTHDYGKVGKYFSLEGSWYLDERRRDKIRSNV